MANGQDPDHHILRDSSRRKSQGCTSCLLFLILATLAATAFAIWKSAA